MTEQKIENLVSQRNSRDALKALRKFNKMGFAGDATYLKVCDWYQRLGLQKEGVKYLLDLEVENKLSFANTQFILWLARFYSSLGAKSYSTGLISGIMPDSVSDHQGLADIFLMNNQFDRAKLHLEAIVQSKAATHREKFVSCLGIVDCRSDVAGIDCLNRQIDLAASFALNDLHQAMLFQIRGECLSKKGEFDLAMKEFVEAESLFFSADQSTDHALLKKWKGMTLSQMGEKHEAVQCLQDSITMMKASGLGQQATQPIYDFAKQNSIDLEPAKESSDPLNHDTKKITLFPKSGEFSLSGQPKLKWPQEIQLASLIAKHNGTISLTEVIDSLFPGEPLNYKYLVKRVHQYINRLKKVYGLEVTISQGYLYSQNIEQDLEVRDLKSAKPVFLLNHFEFQSSDVAGYYDLSKRHTYDILKNWVDLGWVHRIKGNKSILYRTNT